MAARHRHKKAHGGAAESEDPPVKTMDDSKESGVEKEFEEKKRGGRAKRKHGGHVDGMAAKHHLGRPGRKRGGRAGADKSPLTSAAHVTHEGSTAGIMTAKRGGKC